MSIEVVKSYTVDPQAGTATTATEKVEKEAPAKAEEKTEKSATSAETEDAATDQAVEGETEPKPKPKADGGFQRRINKLTREKSEAEARAQKAESELQARTSTGKPAGDDPEPVRPDPSKFSDWDTLDKAKEEYITDKAAWKARQEVKASETKRAAEKQTEDTRTRIKAANERFEKALTEVEDRYEGIHEAVDAVFAKDSDVPVSGAMAEYIMEVSDRGPELIYALHAKPEDADRISKLSPLAAARELAKLEDKLPKPEPKKQSGAPPPPKQVKGSAESPTKKLEDMSPAEYMAHRRDQEKKAGTLRRVVNPR